MKIASDISDMRPESRVCDEFLRNDAQKTAELSLELTCYGRPGTSLVVRIAQPRRLSTGRTQCAMVAEPARHSIWHFLTAESALMDERGIAPGMAKTGTPKGLERTMTMTTTQETKGKICRTGGR